MREPWSDCSTSTKVKAVLLSIATSFKSVKLRLGIVFADLFDDLNSFVCLQFTIIAVAFVIMSFCCYQISYVYFELQRCCRIQAIVYNSPLDSI